MIKSILRSSLLFVLLIILSCESDDSKQEIVDINPFEGTISLRTQEDLNTFGANDYTETTGSLNIENSKGPTAITDLNSLESLRSVTGGVLIGRNEELTSLQGLHNIQFIGNILSIAENPNLESMQGLSGLLELGGPFLLVRQNPKITNLDGFEQVSANNLSLNISDNDLLENVDALSNIQSYSGDINFFDNPRLQNLNGIQNASFSDIDRLSVAECNILTSIEPLAGISSLNHGLLIYKNPLLTNLEGLNDITNIGFGVDISLNDTLQSIDALSALTSVENTVLLRYNYVLTDFCSLTALVTSGNLDGFFTEENGYNPTAQDIIDGNCSL